MKNLRRIARTVLVLMLSLIVGVNASAFDYAPWLYGNQLTGAARLAYDRMTEDYIIGGKAESNMDFTEYGLNQSGLYDAISDAMEALLCDFNYAYFMNALSWTYFSERTSGKVLEATVSPKFRGAFSSIKDYAVYAEKENAKANEILSTVLKTAKTRYEVLDALNDWLVYNSEYDREAVNYLNTDIAETTYWYAWAPYGVLLKGTGVCESYARAFKLCCEKLSIPCVTVTGIGNGGPHEWNYVQMEDGKWYMVDVTFNDTYDDSYFPSYFTEAEKKEYIDDAKHDFFLIGSEAEKKLHRPAPNTTAFSFPTISVTNYVPSGIEESFTVNKSLPQGWLTNYKAAADSAENENADSENTAGENADSKNNADENADSREAEIPPYKKGDSFTDEKTGLTYKVVSASETKGYTVSCTGAEKSISKLVIPKTVTANNHEYKVVAIADKAFYGKTKIKSVKIGSNVASIGSKAFYKCKYLAAVDFSGSKIKEIGLKAFYGIKSTAVFTVPGTKLSAYKKLLAAETGFKSTMKVNKR